MLGLDCTTVLLKLLVPLIRNFKACAMYTTTENSIVKSLLQTDNNDDKKLFLMF